MSRSVKLRPWQHAALRRFAASSDPDFLAVATPGAGKTTFALTALRMALATKPARVVIVAPTAHLKVQWAAAASTLGLHLDPAWSPTADGALPADMHGVVTTYQQVAMSAPALREVARGAFVVLDEVHHAGEEQAWGESLREAFGPAAPDMTHAQVNLELNRLAGMRRIEEATVEQLQSRLDHATRWRWRLAR